MPEENVRVAVRVRPFNKRERGRNATCIVEMNGAETKLIDPEGEDEPKKFAFDFSYWSFDGSRGNADGYYEKDPGHPNGKKFCDQNTVFKDLGNGVLNNAWGGFNSTLFAYGQTGSGKSWSVVGYGVNKGIVPLFCETIFSQIDEKKAGGDTTEFQVFFSMLEIYNEEVRDLLISKNARGGLKVRENPATGFYAQGLTSQPVANYAAIEAKMAEGTANRTVAATQMNATSSRAHTIVSITFVQKYKNAAGAETEKKAVCNLVDLAGSERAGNTGATGDRLKEGAAINLSLSSLGNCIAALADSSSGKKVRVPFRDSVLTKLLKNALGGNSKTVMIAAISPADINYEESLSTLRYADRAKQIKTVAVVNEDPTEKLIRELQEENERLKKALDSGGIELPEGDGSHGMEKTEGMSKADEDTMKKQLAEEYEEAMKANEQRMAEMQRNYDELLKQAEEDDKDKSAQVMETKNKKTTHDYITNLNMDKSLTGYINHFLEDKMTVGNKRGSPSDICLTGPSILEKHATVTKEDGAFHIEKAVETARLFVNGDPITEKTKLNHMDRIMFGTTQMYAFVDHTQKVVELPDFTEAMDEVAESAGIDLSTEGKSKDELLLHDDILDILPMIEEANSLSEEMDKKVVFEPIIVPPEAQGVLKSKKPKVFVHVKNLENSLEVYWSRDEFYARHDLMENMFGRFDDDDDSFDGTIDKKDDPFLIDENEDVHIGSFKVFLECLSYNVEMVERLEIIDYESEQIGECQVELHPCTAKGKVFKPEDDIFVDDPNQLLGQETHFKLKVTKVEGLPKKYKEVYAKFQLERDVDPLITKTAAAPKFEMNFEKVYSFQSLTQKELEYMQTGCFMVQIWGKQTASKPKAVNTKKAGQKIKAAKSQVSVPTKRNPGKKADLKTSTLQQEAKLAKTRFRKFEKRIDWLKNLLREANKRNKKKVPTRLVIQVLEAKNFKEAKAIINSIGKSRGGGKDPHVEGPEEPRLEQPSGQTSDNDSDDEANIQLRNGNLTFRLRL